jgi:hypothetical protein
MRQPNNSDIYIHRRWICADERLSIRENGRRLEFPQISEVFRYLPLSRRSLQLLLKPRLGTGSSHGDPALIWKNYVCVPLERRFLPDSNPE